MNKPISLAASAQLAERVERLILSRYDPEAFHVEKDDVTRTLRRMARNYVERAQ